MWLFQVAVNTQVIISFAMDYGVFWNHPLVWGDDELSMPCFLGFLILSSITPHMFFFTHPLDIGQWSSFNWGVVAHLGRGEGVREAWEGSLTMTSSCIVYDILRDTSFHFPSLENGLWCFCSENKTKQNMCDFLPFLQVLDISIHSFRQNPFAAAKIIFSWAKITKSG